MIAITRLACTHANTEVRDAKTVSCGVNGYTGDTYCKDCGILLQRGKTVAALTHDYRETYISSRPTTRTGIKSIPAATAETATQWISRESRAAATVLAAEPVQAMAMAATMRMAEAALAEQTPAMAVAVLAEQTLVQAVAVLAE
ncbi:hypothetical protein [Gallintestinimicrobium sp.]|uniref:hypothetical protein n=1 Tax=Gallintestinimicrobium sp. TaxID=2981655 RepID=UPI0039961776